MITVDIYPLKIDNLKNFNQKLEHFLLLRAMFCKICYRSALGKALQSFEILF